MIDELKSHTFYWYSFPTKNRSTNEIALFPQIVQFIEIKYNFYRGKYLSQPKIERIIVGFQWKDKLENILKHLENIGLDYKTCFEEIKTPKF